MDWEKQNEIALREELERLKKLKKVAIGVIQEATIEAKIIQVKEKLTK